LRERVRPATRGSGPTLTFAGSAIARITSSGVRTGDGIDHGADTIIYGTGFALDERTAEDALIGARGLSLRRAWYDGMEPYRGVAVHGFPNYFFLAGPDTGAQIRYVSACLHAMTRTAASRIEVRRSSQQVFNERACVPGRDAPAAITKAFDLSCPDGEASQTYDGAATLTVGGIPHPVRVRLTGRLDPLDGQYHWQGTISASSSQPIPDQLIQQSRGVTLTVGDRDAPARIVERTPWGTHSVAGVGAPPYASN
jgi:cation diffusion facilitator CzcD-associated flavoprotein CzcO